MAASEASEVQAKYEEWGQEWGGILVITSLPPGTKMILRWYWQSDINYTNKYAIECYCFFTASENNIGCATWKIWHCR